MLNERAAQVLKAVVESFILNSEPVSSGAISKSYDFNLSPATIRNVMAELEESGFLSQPHTSAGRAPTDQGYRYYAQHLIKAFELPIDQALFIHRAANSSEWLELTELMESVSKTLSTLSRHASLVGLTSIGSTPIKKIQFVHIGPKLALAVMVMANGEMRRYIIKIRGDLTKDSLDRMTNYFNDRFTCLSLAQIRRMLLKELQVERNRVNRMMTSALVLAEELEKLAELEREDQIYIEGASNLIGEGGGREDLAYAKAIFETLGEKGKLFALLDECLKDEGINLIIGAESQIESLSDCSVVTHSFSGYGGMSGAVGIIGRKRMNYGHVMALVGYAATAVNIRLARYSREDLN